MGGGVGGCEQAADEADELVLDGAPRKPPAPIPSQRQQRQDLHPGLHHGLRRPGRSTDPHPARTSEIQKQSLGGAAVAGGAYLGRPAIRSSPNGWARPSGPASTRTSAATIALHTCVPRSPRTG